MTKTLYFCLIGYFLFAIAFAALANDYKNMYMIEKFEHQKCEHEKQIKFIPADPNGYYVNIDDIVGNTNKPRQ